MNRSFALLIIVLGARARGPEVEQHESDSEAPKFTASCQFDAAIPPGAIGATYELDLSDVVDGGSGVFSN